MAGVLKVRTAVDPDVWEVIGNGVATGGGEGVTDGDKGDIVVSASGATWMFDTSVVTAAAKTVLDDASTTAMRTTLGLGNVDNTSDANKPVSTAQATADVLASQVDAGQGWAAKRAVSEANEVWVALGDSTGNETTEWVYLLAQQQATDVGVQFRIEYLLWNDATQAYDTPVIIQDGVSTPITSVDDTFTGSRDLYHSVPDTAGGQWDGPSGTANEWAVASGKATRTSPGLGGLASEGGVAGSQVCTAHTVIANTLNTGVASQCGIGVTVDTTTNNQLYVYFNISAGGTRSWGILQRLAGAATTLITGAAADIPASATATFDMSISINDTAVSATLNGVTINTTLTAPAAAMALSATRLLFTSTQAQVGFTVDRVKMVVTPSPTTARRLRIYNAAMPGSTLAYHIPKLATMIPEPADIVWLSVGHNYGSDTGTQLLTDVDTVIASVRSSAYKTGIICSGQNPQYPPATGGVAHRTRQAELRAHAKRHRYGHIPVWEEFDTGTGSSWVQADGVHPNTTGSGVWRDVAEEYLQTLVQGVASGTIADDSVTNVMLANVATNTIKGRTTASTGDPEDLTPAQARTVIASDSGGGTTNFFRADGTFAAPSGGGGGIAGITVSEAGSALDTDITTLDFLAGFDLTESPENEVNIALDLTEYTGGALPIAGGGTGATAAFAGSTPGVVPTSVGGTSDFLRADGSWAQPPSAFDGTGGHASFVFNATTTAPPASTQIRMNNATNSAATTLWVHEEDFDTLDVTIGLAKILAGHQIYIQDYDDASKWVKYNVTAAVDSGAYFTFTIAYHSGPGGLPTGSGAAGRIELQGIAPGSVGVPPGGTTGQALTKTNSTDYAVQWTSVQASDAELTAIAGLTSAADQVPYFTGSGTASLMTVTSAARGVLDETTTANMLTALGAQPLDTDLTTIAGLTATTGNMILSASSAWTSANPATVKTALSLDNVTNTTDAGKPVSTAQQTALDLKANLNQTINAQTGTTYTLVLTDNGKMVTLTNASAIALTVPTNAWVAFPTGARIDLAQYGAGQVTVGGTPTVNATPTKKSRAQYSGMSLVKLATDEWLLVGDLAAT